VAIAVSAGSFFVPVFWAEPVAVAASLAIGAFGGLVWNVITVSLRQSLVPDELLGRVNSAYRLVGWGTMPFGALAGGLIADAFGLRAPFLVAGIVALLLALWIGLTVTNRGIARARRRAVL
jgi:MFS family permease